MRAIDYIESAYSGFTLRNKFVEVERQTLRDGTVAQLTLTSAVLSLMLKLFVSEMEGEGGLYLAPPGTAIGYREEGGWLSPWTLGSAFKGMEGYDDTSLITLRAMNPISANCHIQLQAELEWFAANVALITDYFAGM